jgi:hypothetical protein
MPSIFLLNGLLKGLLNDASTLVEMTEQSYESEGLLQKLLADHPSVLAGDQFDGAEPKRWLLIRQEAGVPAEDVGTDRWSLDHLFVDQNGIPTLVEVKRSTDNRIRREVVGQMFDYAANAVVYWPERQIRTRYEEDCARRDENPDKKLARFLRLADDPDSQKVGINRFWIEVDSNLRAGRIRMVFVADTIPRELRRIVEFLNEQMNPAEVLAIEIKQFSGPGVTTLVPTIIGQTAQAAAIRESKTRTPKQWDFDTFFEALRVRKGEQVCRIAADLLKSFHTLLPVVRWGQGSADGSCFLGLTHKEKTVYLFLIYTYGRVEVQFQRMLSCPPFDLDAKRIEWRDRLNQMPGLSKFGPEVITTRPAFDIVLLENPDALAKFYDAIEWAVTEIKRL